MILLDLTLPDGFGLDILEKISVEYQTRVIIVSVNGNIVKVVETMRKGAFDFLKKPVDHNVLLVKMKKALNVNRKLDDFRILKYNLSDRFQIEKIIYRIRNMAELEICFPKYSLNYYRYWNRVKFSP